MGGLLNDLEYNTVFRLEAGTDWRLNYNSSPSFHYNRSNIVKQQNITWYFDTYTVKRRFDYLTLGIMKSVKRLRWLLVQDWDESEQARVNENSTKSVFYWCIPASISTKCTGWLDFWKLNVLRGPRHWIGDICNMRAGPHTSIFVLK